MTGAHRRPGRGRQAPLVVLGDAIADIDVTGEVRRICPDAPVPVLEPVSSSMRPGGAALAAAVAAGSGEAGSEVVLVTALARDDAGRRLVQMLEAVGVEVVAAEMEGPTPCKVRLRSHGQSLLRCDYGSHSRAKASCPERAEHAIGSACAVVVADYGLGVAEVPELRRLLASAAQVVWDPHPKGAFPVAGARLVVPNRDELFGSGGLFLAGAETVAVGSEHSMAATGPSLASICRQARIARRHWRAHGVAVTLGEKGAVLVSGDGPPLVVPAGGAGFGDTCGAGDCFAVEAALALGEGALPSEATARAVAAASAWVRRGGAAAWSGASLAAGPAPGLPAWPLPWDSDATARPAWQQVPDPPVALGSTGAPTHLPGRTGGRPTSTPITLVAAGGCFDVLHAGHVQLLQSARALGDRLVVCVNSDRSVRRLKGVGRPVVSEADRVAMLRALACVDEVVVFDEDTPARVLGELRPQLFVKGGDYGGHPLPEEEVLAAWGGQVAVVPYLAGRSTTRVIRRVREASS